MSRPDPRGTITPDAFAVAPELLGLPLASGRRRAAAMAVDLLVVAFLVNAGALLFGMAVAWVFFRIATRRQAGRLLPRAVRLVFGTLGAVVLFGVAVALSSQLFDEDDDEDRDEAPVAQAAGRGGSALLGAAQLVMLQQADSEEEARELAEGFAEQMREAGASTEQVRETLAGVAEEAESAQVRRGVRSALAPLDSAAARERAAPDSLVRAYAAALSGEDTAAARTLRPRVVAVLAADTARRMREEVEELRGRNRRLEAELDRAREERGLLRALAAVADELGIGFGWTGLYFTAFLALWRGQTPGKRLLGMRVVRLSGAPITWWTAFERFGGYAASLFTGLLGFFQLLWDRNRQALHDKIVETVVIRV